MSLVWLLGLTVAGTALAWVGADALERSADRLAAYYGLPQMVQGAVLAAVGSSMPELMTAVLAPLLHDNFELGVAAIIGSAIFNILVIPAVSRLSTEERLTTNRNVVYKEVQFYLIAVAVFLLVLSLAVIYAPVPGEALMGELTPAFALALLGLYALYIFTQYLDTAEHVTSRDGSRVSAIHEWVRFVGGFVLILVGVEALLRAALGFGEAFGTPSLFWGVTVVAAATSLPDTFVSVRAADRDRATISIANVCGSNVFDLLVAVPAGVLVVGGTVIDFARLAPLSGVLVAATVAVFTVLRTDLELTRREAWFLLVLYGVFLLWMAAEAFSMLGFVA